MFIMTRRILTIFSLLLSELKKMCLFLLDKINIFEKYKLGNVSILNS